jgi:integrase/recombinase XerD
MRYRIREPWVPACMQKAVPEGPLVSYLRPFGHSLIEQGYFGNYLRRHVKLAMYFSQWLKRRGVGLRGITSEHVSGYLKWRDRQRLTLPDQSAAIGHLIMFLRSIRAIPAGTISEPPLTPVERAIRAYEQYSIQKRGLASVTVANYARFIRDFLKDRFSDGAVKLSCLSAADVNGFVQRRAPSLRRRQAKSMTIALRSFLRYARWRGAIKLDLAAAVPTVPNWSMSSVPRAIAPDKTTKLLRSIDRQTQQGCRDYAVLLLLARLGLRAGEVASLELDDIDWSAGRLSARVKGSRRSEMPMSVEVGKAIAVYLRQGRPKSSSRRVFLRLKAPHQGFRGQSAVGSIVRHALLRAGIDSPTRGAHQFRFGLASQMLRQGASLAEIGALLGHQHPDTTRIYTKIDLKALHTLALPWPRAIQ